MKKIILKLKAIWSIIRSDAFFCVCQNKLRTDDGLKVDNKYVGYHNWVLLKDVEQEIDRLLWE